MTTQTRPSPRKPTDIGVDGPTPRDMMRSFTTVRADPLAFLASTQEQYGDLAAYPVPGPPVLLLNDPADVRQVLQTGARHWGKETIQYAALGRVTGPGLLASSDPSWIEHRRVAAPAFHHRRLDDATRQVQAAARTATATWSTLPPEGRVVDLAQVSMRIALDVVGRTLFSADLSDRAHDLLDATSKAAKLIVALGRSIVPVPAWLPTPMNLRLRATGRKLDALSHDLIDCRRLQGSNGSQGSPASQGSHGNDLLGLLLDGGLSDKEIRDELVTMVVAGHETVAAALSWTFMLLAEDQTAQDRLRAEVRARGTATSLVGGADDLPWTRAVVDESLRLYPPAWVVSRRSSAPDVIGGLPVPSDTTVIISPWLLHRREESWPQADRFRPERFAQGASTRARSDYLPFGLGPRLCIGREFALGEMTVVLSELLADYRVTTTPGWSRPAAETLVAVHPHGGMRLRVAPVAPDPSTPEAPPPAPPT